MNEGQAAAARREGPGRMGALDSARGASMGLVCLAHFVQIWSEGQAPGALRGESGITALTQLASPSFVLLSGLLLGLSYARRPEALAVLRLRCADRGLFLLTVGHLLILPTHLQWLAGDSAAPRILFITDTIGVALLVGPALLARLGARALLGLGLGLVLAGWALLFAWRLPPGSDWRLLKHALVGHEDVNSWVFNFPLLPWLGLYLAATALGQRLGAPGGGRLLRRVGTGLLLLALGLGLVHLALRLEPHAEGTLAQQLLPFSSPFRKLPPGPTYFALYAGLALHLLALLMAAERRGWAERFLRASAQVGRHSLFAFVVQYYVYFVGVRLLQPHVRGPWPLAFAASLLLVVWLVRRWEALGGSRWITVGLRSRAQGAPALPPG